MAEYSDLDLPACQVILGEYGFEPSSLRRLVGGAANSSFHVNCTNGGELVVTLVDNHESVDVKELTLLIACLEHHEIPVDGVVPTMEGELFTFRGSTPVIVRPFVSGSWPEASDLESVRKVGRLLGSIHAIPAPPTLRRGGRLVPIDWSDLLGADAPVDLVSVLRKGEQIKSAESWERLEPVLCHGDLFPDNLLQREDGSLVALDWETASVDPAVLDLGISIAAFWDAVENFGFELVAQMIVSGYREVRSLSDAEVAQLGNSTFYALAMLAFHRFYRHNVKFPNCEKSDTYRELVSRANCLSDVHL